MWGAREGWQSGVQGQVGWIWFQRKYLGADIKVTMLLLPLLSLLPPTLTWCSPAPSSFVDFGRVYEWHRRRLPPHHDLSKCPGAAVGCALSHNAVLKRELGVERLERMDYGSTSGSTHAVISPAHHLPPPLSHLLPLLHLVC